MTNPFPFVQGVCPACGGVSLFLAAGGYVTCARLECSDPEAATNLLTGGIKPLSHHTAPAPTIGARWRA